MIHLIADVLDEQVCDVKGEHAGRADGIVLTLRVGRPPIVSFVEVGPTTLLARFSLRLAAWYGTLDRRFGPDRGKPFRIPWKRITVTRRGLIMDCTVDETSINAVENWLRATIVEKIPGA